jgi:CRISPR-associated protein Cas2
MHLVICYDVVSDRRRGRLMRKLKAYLPHVQKSVFEGELGERQVVELRQAILQVIDPGEDTVRIYQQCGRCLPATEVLGVGVYVARGDEDEVY